MATVPDKATQVLPAQQKAENTAMPFFFFCDLCSVLFTVVT